MELDASVSAAILRGLPVGVWVARAPDGAFMYANEAFELIMGMGPVPEAAAVSGGYSAPYGIFNRDGQPYPEHQLPFARALAARTTVMVDDLVIHRRDGRQVNVRAFGKPFFGLSGEVDAVMVSFFDITDQVKAERDAAESRVRLGLAVKHAPVIIWATDKDGVVTLSEGAGLAALKVRSGELVGRRVDALFPTEPEVLANVQRALSGVSFETRSEVSGAMLEGWMGPTRDARGEIIGVMGIHTDITERHQAQQRMVRAERVAAMGSLAASVAHEINNPLAYVLEGLRSLKREVGVSSASPEARAKLERLIADVNDGAERVRVITADLQTFARNDDDSRYRVDVTRAAESALQLVGRQLESKAHVALELDDEAVVMGTEPRLVQVFVNLLMNAAQALPEGAPKRNEITLRVKAEPRQVVAEVLDSGPGIAEGLIERIFEPFVTTKPVGEGTGLGLFVCRNLVTELGGSIEAMNRVEGGALFRVRLPRAGVPLEVAEPPPVTARSGAKVLLIDDNVNLGRVMANALDLAQHQPVVVHSGREAVERLTGDEAFDLVFCDLMMKDVSGMDVYEEVRRRRPGAEAGLVFMTGGAFTDRARRFLASVPNERLQKPFDICDQVARLLERRAR